MCGSHDCMARICAIDLPDVVQAGVWMMAVYVV